MNEDGNKKKKMAKLFVYSGIFFCLLFYYFIISRNYWSLFIDFFVFLWMVYLDIRLGNGAFKPVNELSAFKNLKNREKSTTKVYTCKEPLQHISPKVKFPEVYTISEIDAMNGFEFERYMKKVYEKLGYSAHHTPLSGDQGADLILTSNEGIRTAVQVKRYNGRVSNSAVQEVVAAKGFYKCTRGIVVTNSYFMDSAIKLAQANSINLIDRDGLTKLLKESSYLWN